MSQWKRYRKRGETEMVPWTMATDMRRVSVSDEDRENGSPQTGDMIARNPRNRADQWLVSRAYFAENYVEAE